MSVAVVIPAAGAGQRLGGTAKPFVTLAGRPLLAHTLQPFLDDTRVACIVVALPAAHAAHPPQWLCSVDARIRIVAGGVERGDSVRAGLAAVPSEIDVVLIHDAARPLVTREVVDRAIAAAERGLCAVVGVPVADTIQEVDDTGRIITTPDRALLRQAQTPQAFPRAIIVDAYARAAADGVGATDDAALVTRYGGVVFVIEGDRENLKVTTPADVAVADALLRARNP
jgi:2-C-methyl-D-erythritol 4-phosphate cytidylyltransferase